jgi:hypothetical protein
MHINAAAPAAAQKWCMEFDPRRIFNIEVAGIATIVLSMAARVVLFFAL